MILLLGGTQEAGVLAGRLKAAGKPFITTVTSDYGMQLAREQSAQVVRKCLDRQSLVQLIRDKGINIIIDITHPYAEEISKLASAVAEEMGIEYYRYERPAVVGGDPLVEKVDSYEEAAVKAVQLAFKNKGNIFLTIGSKRLVPFVAEAQKLGVRVVARVLPDADVLRQVFALGLTPKDVIAVLGPFSHSLNKAMFEDYGAGVVVTKDAGSVGGADTKISAALELGIPVLVIKRPETLGKNVFTVIDEILRRVI
ncbi:precorrin-6x reductase [Thermincola ferriacetica]|uniref:Precorrin-6x reductase n=1 Tax=Thermincola ferriacetica TaxID=281456 RepID=A0A0L6W5X9_9FIRM|nr:precorrin-6A reductase [Thermincola ferriacetica]KNZ70910.1 precorrin-6x reductase [Thermincola ferriacetica]